MSKVFESYAEYYDLLYDEKPYDKETDYIEGLIRKYRPKAKTIMELGCGTGVHAVHLAKRGFSVHGIDLSEEMLKRAESRRHQLAEKVSAKLNFKKGDIRSFRAHGDIKFDVVLSLFHVLSYQVTNEDLKRTFDTAAAHLASEGMFIFDFWYGPSVLTQNPSVRVKRMENEKIKVMRIAEPLMFFEKNCVQVNYSIQVWGKGDGNFAQTNESHLMRYLFLPEIEMLAGNQFRVRSNLAWLREQPPDVENWAALSILECLS